MKKMKKILLILFFALAQIAAFAQLSLNLNIGFEPDPDILNWAAQPNTLQVTVTNSSNQTIQYKYAGKLTRNGQLAMDNIPAKMPIVTIGPFETIMAYVEDVVPVNAVKLYGDIQATYARTNSIPGGQYLACVKIIDLQGKELAADNCRPFQMTSYQQPALISPLASTPVSALARPMFSWTPVTPTPLFGVVYRLRVVELPDNELRGQTAVTGLAFTYEAATGIEIFYPEDRKITGVWQRRAKPRYINSEMGTGTINTATNRASNNSGPLSTEAMRALNYGFPMIDVELNGLTQYLWPPDVQEPLAGRSYVWSVESIRADNGKPIGDNNGLSQAAQFFISADDAVRGGVQKPIKAPDFIVADENGCLYGCTTEGGVWEPFDCPEQTRAVASLPKTLTLQYNPEAKEGEKRWAATGTINTATNRVAVGLMLPLSRFKLAHTGNGSVNPLISRDSGTGTINTATNRVTIPPSECLDPKTVLFKGGEARISIKLCYNPSGSGCIVVIGNKPCPDAMRGVQIVAEAVPSKGNGAVANRAATQPQLTIAQILPFIAGQTDFKTPLILDMASDDKLKKVNSVAECTGVYSLILTDCCAGEGGGQGPSTLKTLICYSSENPNGMFPVILCFNLCNLKPDNNTVTPVDATDGWPCLNLAAVTVMPDIQNGTIAIQTVDGKSLCLNPDGTCRPCNGKLPTKEEIEKARAAAGGNTANTTRQRAPCGNAKCTYCYGFTVGGKTTAATGFSIDMGNHGHAAGYDPACVQCQKTAWRPLRVPNGRYEACKDADGDYELMSCTLCKAGQTCVTITVVNFGAVPPPNPSELQTRETAHIPPTLDLAKLNAVLKGTKVGQSPFFISQTLAGDLKRIAKMEDGTEGSYVLRIEVGNNPTTRTMGDPVPGMDIKLGRKPPGGNIIATGVTDNNGNVELNSLLPELGKTYYVEYGIREQRIKGAAKTVEIPLKDFEKGWVVVGNRGANPQPIVVTQKVGDEVVTITYIKNGVRVNVSKAKK